MARMSKAAFERSGFDNDKGVKEGSRADKKRDAKEMKAAAKKGAAPKKAPKRGMR